FRRKSNIGPVGPTANHQQGWWFVTLGLIKKVIRGNQNKIEKMPYFQGKLAFCQRFEPPCFHFLYFMHTGVQSWEVIDFGRLIMLYSR
ncbi:MAG: hypothetical protein K1W08_00225, partial [Lachnospiraceae bacterium]